MKSISIEFPAQFQFLEDIITTENFQKNENFKIFRFI